MKLTAIALALVAFANAPAFAETSTVLGCEVVDMGGYSNKADPTCAFDVIGNQHSTLTIDPDGVVDSGDEFTVVDTDKQD